MGGVMTRRVRRFLSSVAISAAAMAIAAPAAIAQQFHGGGYLTNLANCEDVNLGSDLFELTARYEPGELAEDGKSRLTLILNGNYTMSLESIDGVFTDSFAPVRGAHTNPTFEWIRPNPRVRLVRQQPAEADQNTGRIRARLIVRNLFAVQRCLGTVELELVRR